MRVVRQCLPMAVMLSILLCGCPAAHRDTLTTDLAHVAKFDLASIERMQADLLRQVENMTREIQGPLKDEIAAYVKAHIMRIGPLAYHSRDYAENQLKEAAKIPDIVADYLTNSVWDAYGELVDQLHKYGLRQSEMELPQAVAAYRRFMRYHKQNATEFVESFKRYDRINREMILDLTMSIDRFIEWQKHNALAIPRSTERYMQRLATDFDNVMNSTAKMFDHNLTEEPLELRDALFKYTRYNTEEVLSRLGASAGRYFWEELDVSMLTKEMHCFAERNVTQTRRTIEAVGKYFAVNAQHGGILQEEVTRFFEWRSREWASMKNELDRYISRNVQNYEMFKKAPLRYLEKQTDEWELLMETVPRYFVSNWDKGEGLGFALRRYFEYNIGD